RLSVGRPRGVELVAGVDIPGTVAGILHQPRPREQIFRWGIGVEALREDVELPIVEPAVPPTDRKTVVGTQLILAIAAFDGRAPVRLFVGCVRIDEAADRDGPAVRTERRLHGPAADGCHAPRLAAAGDVEHVDLVGLVALAPCRKSNPTAV